MRLSPILGIHVFLCALLGFGAFQPTDALGQVLARGVKEAYFEAVADYFEVTLEEVSIVGAWDLDPDEVPVVLFVSRRAGVSADVLIGLRRSGRSWQEVGKRFGLGARSFHLPLPADMALGPLDRAYTEFRSHSAREWDQIDLADPEIISLVNLRVLSDHLGVSPLRILQSQEEAGSYAAGFTTIRSLSGARPTHSTPF